MKFKKDEMGWRDLGLSSDGSQLQVCIPDLRAAYTPSGKPFICITECHESASLRLSRAQLKTLANKILKELDRK